MKSKAWRQVFADTVIRLRPDLNPDAVDELSDAAWLRLAGLPPAEAAARCAPAGALPADHDHPEAALPS